MGTVSVMNHEHGVHGGEAVQMSPDIHLESYGQTVDEPLTYHGHDQVHHPHTHPPSMTALSAGGTFGRLSAAQPQQHHSGGGQFGILTPPNAVQVTFSPGAHANGQPSGRIVVDPPELQVWRERLFSVGEMIVLTNEQYETYFPHVDNVYSHPLLSATSASPLSLTTGTVA
jgi:hypothetical protein